MPPLVKKEKGMLPKAGEKQSKRERNGLACPFSSNSTRSEPYRG
jgi:hypothetical protein